MIWFGPPGNGGKFRQSRTTIQQLEEPSHQRRAGYQFLQHICLYISFGLLLIRAYLALAGGLCTNGMQFLLYILSTSGVVC